jgi:NADH-quinone oxidoreductase subunit L
MEYVLMVGSVLWALIGISVAAYFYLKRTDIPARMAKTWKGLYELSLNKYYVDEIYGAVFVNGCVALSRHFWKFWDVVIIDGAVNGLGALVRGLGTGLAKVQNGQVQGYALAIVLGAVILVAYVATYAAF